MKNRSWTIVSRAGLAILLVVGSLGVAAASPPVLDAVQSILNVKVVNDAASPVPVQVAPTPTQPFRMTLYTLSNGGEVFTNTSDQTLVIEQVSMQCDAFLPGGTIGFYDPVALEGWFENFYTYQVPVHRELVRLYVSPGQQMWLYDLGACVAFVTGHYQP